MSTAHYAEGEEPSPADVELALADAVGALEEKGVPYLLMGGLGSTTFGRPRLTDDVDLFVRVDDARRVLDILDAGGFETDETALGWLHKAYRHGVLIDVIFRSAGDILLDDEMLQRGRRRTYEGTDALMMCPEDLVVIKAMAASEETIHHWYDALGLIAMSGIDWDYLLRRAVRSGPRRLLSLLLYAESNDLPVPAAVIETLFETVHPGAGGPS
jgi:predicted nucleotidyltransferase